MIRSALIVLAAGAALLLAPPTAGTATGGGRTADDARIPGRYIVVYRQSLAAPGRKTDRLEQALGFDSLLRYGTALKGFSAKLSRGQVARLRDDPNVSFVSPDRRVKARGAVPLAPGEPVPPTAVRRIGAATTTTAREASGVNVAVIDTGVDLSHPDLNAVHGKNCVRTGFFAPGNANDDNGHGSHVAGTIAARNNGSGVVGVAPGTKIYAVKVLNGSGSGTVSQVICGIDWVTSTRTDSNSANDVAVANMSLGGAGPPVKSCATTTDAEHKAICNSVAAGVTYVVAAGNDGWDFDYAPSPDTPAAYPEALTVTAMSDSDGQPGASGGAPTCRSGEADDRYATFSNYAATAGGAAHTVAAPGVCVSSTWRKGGYSTISGTSMASPAVAGAVALCLNEGGTAGPCSGLAPAQLIQRVRSDAMSRTDASFAYGFTGDPLRPLSGRYFGYLAWAGPLATGPDNTPPTVTGVSPAAEATGVATGTTVDATFSEAMDTASTQSAFSLVRSSNGQAVGGSFSWSGNTLVFRPSTALAAGARYVATVRGGASSTPARDAAGNALASDHAWAFTTASAGGGGSTVTTAPGGVVVEAGSLSGGSAASLAQDDNSYLSVRSTTSYPRQSSWYGAFGAVPNSLSSLAVSYKGKNSQSCSQTVSLYNWTSSSWVALDTRSVGSTEVAIDKPAAGTPADYVSGASGAGEVRVRVACQASSFFGAAFTSSGDRLAITYQQP